MRVRQVAVLATIVLTSSSVAFAEAPRKAKEKIAKFVAVASVEAPTSSLPQLPPSSPSSAIVPSGLASPAPSAAGSPKDEPATLAGGASSAGPGFVLAVGTGMTYLGGRAAEGASIGAGLATLELKLGGYLTPHFGLMAGIEGGYGGVFDGCDGCEKAAHYQIPIVAQVAFTDRRRGAYLEGGFAVLSTYFMHTDPDGPSRVGSETIKMSSPVDAKLGGGYRFPVGDAVGKPANVLDLRFAVDLGQFTTIDYRSSRERFAGDIPSGNRAMHFALGFGLAYHFAP